MINALIAMAHLTFLHLKIKDNVMIAEEQKLERNSINIRLVWS